MKLITVAGPPSSGKTSVIIRLIECMDMPKSSIGVVKFDCLTSFDNLRYNEANIPNETGFSGKICPDHFFVSNIEDAVQWGIESNFEMLITESAGLCNRCSPYINGILSICVIDNLSGINTPRKIGPMLKFADIVVVTKGDIVSQAEREVFTFNIKQVNTSAKVIFVNGITGQGSFLLAKYLKQAQDIHTLKDMKLKFTTPAAVCSYCTGETKIGDLYQMGMMKKMEFNKL
ncbi:Ni2+-binding GTPase involved in maturation of urease and hydrogenase [Alkalibaculum bacchi]|uniref:Ni2+-binding GTPase involved in maturation of urease and hydrogenase n=1 Tax=Alkalibaculum bacchi TaxID=645887 RepID=A0A366I9U7_9FIRM|nr:GTP-binding protein [Alkalibaculum bacchi]RBP66711.1 Ni2+-binding GTPase involved in maturation of urease and hydrogenase [Alkalibaculum bacchi]